MFDRLKRLFAKPTYKYVSWYRSPTYLAPVEYLRAFPAGSCCQDSWGPGYEYVRERSLATRFETEAEAWAVTPGYDGSLGLDKRCGVIAVRN